MPVQAILFDLDNTLYPASSGLIRHVEQRIREFVMTTRQVDEATARDLCGHFYATYGTTLRGLQTHFGEVDAAAYLDYIHNVPIEEYVNRNDVLIEALAGLPLRKAVFTNSVHEYAERVLQRIGIRDQFEKLFDVRYFNLVGKPDPGAYRHILEYMGLPGEAVVMVDDGVLNLSPARALGMVTMLVDETGVLQTGADYIVPDVLTAIEMTRSLILPQQNGHPPQLQEQLGHR